MTLSVVSAIQFPFLQEMKVIGAVALAIGIVAVTVTFENRRFQDGVRSATYAYQRKLENPEMLTTSGSVRLSAARETEKNSLGPSTF
jgi:hypothetical protein